MEESVKFGVLGCGLAIRNLEAIGCVTRLLDEDLGERDHVGIVIELFGQVDHRVGSILLVAIPAGGEEGLEGLLGDRSTLIGTTSFSLYHRPLSLNSWEHKVENSRRQPPTLWSNQQWSAQYAYPMGRPRRRKQQ